MIGEIRKGVSIILSRSKDCERDGTALLGLDFGWNSARLISDGDQDCVAGIIFRDDSERRMDELRGWLGLVSNALSLKSTIDFTEIVFGPLTVSESRRSIFFSASREIWPRDFWRDY